MKKIISLALAAVMLALTVSCAGDNDNDPTTATSAQGGGSTTSAPEVTQEFKPEEADFGGYSFRMFGYESYVGSWKAAEISEIYAEAENGEPINDSVYNRNRKVEDLYNIDITLVPVNYQNRTSHGDIALRPILAGEDTYDAALVIGSRMPQIMTVVGASVDLKSISTLDLDRSWWNANSIKNLSIGGELHAVTGDISLYNTFAGEVYFINKKLLADHAMQNPYEAVRSGKWTLDAAHEMSKMVAKDLNGNGTVDQDDQFGIVSANVMMEHSVRSTGERYTAKNNDDIPTYTLNSNTISAKIDKVLEVLRDPVAGFIPERASGFGNVYLEYAMPKFRDNEALLLVNQLLVAFDLRDMQADFGILPMPKFDGTQDEYITTVNDGWATFLWVPSTNPDLERTGTILNALGYYSREYMTPAFFDVTVTNKLIRDTDSLDMLNIIKDSYTYDLGSLYNWGTMTTVLSNIMVNGANTFASDYAAREDLIKTAMQTTLDAVLGK